MITQSCDDLNTGTSNGITQTIIIFLRLKFTCSWQENTLNNFDEMCEYKDINKHIKKLVA